MHLRGGSIYIDKVGPFLIGGGMHNREDPFGPKHATSIDGVYVVKFNKRHHRYGHLFQNRYKSIVCQEDSYLMELVRYIHLNLIRVGMVKGLGKLNRSPWSGHSAYGERYGNRNSCNGNALSFC